MKIHKEGVVHSGGLSPWIHSRPDEVPTFKASSNRLHELTIVKSSVLKGDIDPLQSIMDSFLSESFVYLVWGGLVQVIFAVVAAPFAYLVWLRVSRELPSAFNRGYLVLNFFLLLWGCLGHYGFLHIAYGKLYVSVDRWVDWFPFIPFGHWVLRGMGPGWEGHLIGNTTMGEMRLLWLTIAGPVWILALWFTRLTLRMISPFSKSRA